MDGVRIRTAPWIYGMLSASLVLATLGAFALNAPETEWLMWSLVAFSALLVAGLLEAVTTRIETRDETIEIVSKFKKIVIPKSSIQQVSWEKGEAPFLKLTNGSFVVLPETGRNSQRVAISVRSWLKLS
jgi:hypothetical protein